MNILSRQPATLAQVRKYVQGTDESLPIHAYLKDFATLSEEKSAECIQDLKALNNPKINEMILVKLVDFLPQDMEDLHKIFNESSLSDEEGASILEIIKKY